MTVASFVAAQRTDHGVPHVISCRALGVSSWFYKWRDRPRMPRQRRRDTLDDAVKRSVDASAGRYGSPRVLADLVADGWRVSKKSVEASMARQSLVARPTRTRRGWLTRPEFIMDDEMTMLIGPASDGTLLEIGVVRREGDTLIAHAIISRPKFLR